HAAIGPGTASGTATGFTERTDNANGSGSGALALVTGEQAGAASVVTSVAYAGAFGINWIAVGINWLAAAGGGGGGATDEPNVGALTATGQAPTIVLPRVMRPAAGTVSATGFAPTVLPPRVRAAVARTNARPGAA